MDNQEELNKSSEEGDLLFDVNSGNDLITTFISNEQREPAKLLFEVLDSLSYKGMFSAALTPDSYTVTHWGSSGNMSTSLFALFYDAELLFSALQASEYFENYVDVITLEICEDVVDDIIIYYGPFDAACELYNLTPLIEEV